MIEDDLRKNFTKDKLYNWILSLIEIHSVEYRIDYITIDDLIRNTLENNEDSIESTLILDDNTYKFTMKLEKKDISPINIIKKALNDLDEV